MPNGMVQTILYVGYNMAKIINLKNIATQLEYKTEEAKIMAMARKAIKNGCSLYIRQEDIQNNKDAFFYASSHKLYRPKYTYKNKTLAQYIKDNDLQVSVETVRKRIRRGLSIEEALHCSG